MLFDTHCHLDLVLRREFEKTLTENELVQVKKIITAAAESGTTFILNVATSVVSTYNSSQLAKTYDQVFATGGLHPTDVTTEWRKLFDQILPLVEEHKRAKLVAIGETGIDLYHTPDTKLLQQEAFEAHIAVARQYDLPLVVHLRDRGGEQKAFEAALEVLSSYKGRVRGTLHCFSYDRRAARKIIDQFGFVIGIDGPITYPKNDELRAVVREVPLESLVLETDAPFLPPQVHRGKPNHPAYLSLVAQEIARLKELSYEQVADQTTKNAQSLFSL